MTLNNSNNILINDTFNNSYLSINSILTVENKNKNVKINLFIFENDINNNLINSNVDRLIKLENILIS